jgi:hypothetical protein
MVKKLLTGLAISVGAGLALTATTRANKKGLWHPSKSQGTLTPVTIRVHTAATRTEQTGTELARLGDNVATVMGQSRTSAEYEELSLTTSQTHLAELAGIRVMIESMEQRSTEMMSTVNQRIDDLQNHLPRFIDVKVTSRIREVEERLRTEFQDEQGRTLDAFLKTLEQKVLPRIAVIEEAVGAQGAEIGHMRHRIEKTDETLDRVLDRIEKVVDTMAIPFAAHTNSHFMEITQKAVA